MVSTMRALPDVAALDVDDAKQALRSHLRHARRSRSARECATLAEDLKNVALEVIEVAGGAECVAAYVSRPTEPGTAPLLSALYQQGTCVLLPSLGPGLSRGWSEFRGAADLSIRAPGRPPEPSGESAGPETLSKADIVVTPALAVDTAGYRLGQGGGWYDRALRHVRPGAFVICAVYEEEVVDGLLPRDKHDVPVHAVLTPSRWWRVG